MFNLKGGYTILKIKDPNYLRRTLKIFIIALIIMLIAFILAFIFSPSLETFKKLTSGEHSKISTSYGLSKVWQFILNNAFQVPFQMFILSLIPIPFLYFLNIISTSIITGIVSAFALHLNFSKSIVMIIASIPHITIELLAMAFVISPLYKLNQSIIRKVSNLFRNNKKENISFRITVINLFKIYLLYALPLYIIAAFLETYFTAFIYNLFT